MEGLHNQVFSPASLSELFASWSRYPDAVPYAGGTYLVGGQGSRSFSLPRNIMSLSGIDELRRVSRTERYLEFGAAVTLSEILNLGKIVPDILRASLADVATPQVRNLATIGGNVCCMSRRLDSSAPLAVLDARFELRTAVASRWVSAARFAPDAGAPLLDRMELLTRIRIPLETWNYSLYKRIGSVGLPNEDTAAFAFIARTEKNILSEVRLAMAGLSLVRDRSIENAIVGKSLPLSRKEASLFRDSWREKLMESEGAYPADLLKDRFLNLVSQSISVLTD